MGAIARLEQFRGVGCRLNVAPSITGQPWYPIADPIEAVRYLFCLYLQRFGTGTDYSYKLYTTNYTEIQYIKNSDGSITNLGSFYFSRATTSGNSVVNDGVMDDTNYSNLLYSRSNRGIDGCNALLSR